MKDTAHIISPFSRGVTKTGQSVSYRSGDDGEYESGWWLGRLLANNIQRFILHAKYPTDLVIDRATGLMWPCNQNGDGGNDGILITWNAAIDYCNVLNWCSYTDWRLPSVKELASIVDYGCSYPSIDTNFFNNIVQTGHWTSTTYHSNTAYARWIRFEDGQVTYTEKVNDRALLAVRGGL